MRFAVFENQKLEATPKAQGVCPSCGAELIARCGTRKIWHWAHKGRRHCDHWWENETKWHRNWKNSFPSDWQEVPSRDEHGELHIADIKTPKGLVVEFQHSYLKPEEARKRTQFYKQMIWVVDGTRRTSDEKQFQQAMVDARKHQFDEGTVYEVYYPEFVRLFREWAGLGPIIAFDFGKDKVWLLRRILNQTIYGFEYPKENLIQNIEEGTVPPDVLFGEPSRQSVSAQRRGPRYNRRF